MMFIRQIILEICHYLTIILFLPDFIAHLIEGLTPFLLKYYPILAKIDCLLIIFDQKSICQKILQLRKHLQLVPEVAN